MSEVGFIVWLVDFLFLIRSWYRQIKTLKEKNEKLQKLVDDEENTIEGTILTYQKKIDEQAEEALVHRERNEVLEKEMEELKEAMKQESRKIRDDTYGEINSLKSEVANLKQELMLLQQFKEEREELTQEYEKTQAYFNSKQAEWMREQISLETQLRDTKWHLGNVTETAKKTVRAEERKAARDEIEGQMMDLETKNQDHEVEILLLNKNNEELVRENRVVLTEVRDLKTKVSMLQDMNAELSRQSRYYKRAASQDLAILADMAETAQFSQTLRAEQDIDGESSLAQSMEGSDERRDSQSNSLAATHFEDQSLSTFKSAAAETTLLLPPMGSRAPGQLTANFTQGLGAPLENHEMDPAAPVLSKKKKKKLRQVEPSLGNAKRSPLRLDPAKVYEDLERLLKERHLAQKQVWFPGSFKIHPQFKIYPQLIDALCVDGLSHAPQQPYDPKN